MIIEIAMCAGVLVYVGDKLCKQFPRTRVWKMFQKADQEAEDGTLPAKQALAKHHHHLIVSTASLGIVLFNANPVVAAINIGIMAYTALPMLQLGIRRLVTSRTISHDFLLSCVSVLCLITGKHLAFVLNSFFYHFGKRMAAKAQEDTRVQLRHVFEQQPFKVWILKDQTEVEIPLKDLKTGDIVVVNTGSAVPVDGTIAEGFAMIDQHALTGEAVLAEKQIGDRVFASTLVVSGRICIQVETTGEDTMVSQIGQVLEQTLDYKTTVQMKGEKWADWSGLPILALGGVSYPFLGIQGATAVLNSGYGNRIRLFGSLGTFNYLTLGATHGLFIKDGRVFEQVPHVDTVIFDKTGTLTTSQLSVSEIIPCQGVSEQEVLRYAATAEQKISHPIARAILQRAEAEKIDLPDMDDAIYHSGYGITVSREDQVICVGSTRFMEQEGIGLPPFICDALRRSHENQGSLLLVAVNREVMGGIEMRHALRPEVRSVIAGLRRRGVRHISILSGDYEQNTQALAEALEVDSWFAQVLPEQKADIVTRFQQEGRTVCFVGDGVNDAIAIRRANVSVSLRGATTLATDLAQVVLPADDLTQMTTLFDLAHSLNRNLKTSFAITLFPVALNLTGIFFMNFHVLTTIIVNEGIGVGLGLANALWPARRRMLQMSDTPGKLEDEA